jgi:outer membrane lipoprotein-sorting protein
MKLLRAASQFVVLAIALLSSLMLSGQSPANSSKELDTVLKAMDEAAPKFKSAEADVKVELYSRAADDREEQTGKVYFRKKGHETEMAARFNSPAGRAVVYTGGCVQLYEPKIKQITKYCAENNREAVESFLNIGFGGSGRELLTSFDVSYGGAETVDSKKTEKLVLTPKVTKVKNMFDKITLWIWIDPQTTLALSVKQEFLEPSGDSRTSYYTNIHSPAKISEDVFKLPSNASIVSPK